MTVAPLIAMKSTKCESLDAYKVQVGATRALKSEIEALEGARDKAKHIATPKRKLWFTFAGITENQHLTAKIDKTKAHRADAMG